MRLLSIVTLVCLILPVSSYGYEPRYHNAVLEERTKLALDISPGLSTRLVFPFLIDKDENEPTFKISVPNNTVFKVAEAEANNEGALQGQNTLVISANMLDGEQAKNPIHYSNIYLSVNGYHLTLALSLAPLNSKNYFTDVFFSLTDKDQTYLLNKIIDKKIDALERSYQEKEKELKAMAKAEAIKNISDIALAEPEDYRIKEEYDLEFGNGQRIELYVDKAISYDRHYFILAFEMENKSNSDIELKHIILEASTNDTYGEIKAALNCPDVLRARELVKCGLVSENSALFDSENARMKFTTDAGGGIAEW